MRIQHLFRKIKWWDTILVNCNFKRTGRFTDMQSLKHMTKKKQRFSLPVSSKTILVFITRKFYTLFLYWSCWTLQGLSLRAPDKVRVETLNTHDYHGIAYFHFRKSTPSSIKDLLKRLKNLMGSSLCGATLISPPLAFCTVSTHT